jgi:DNA modification methylase
MIEINKIYQGNCLELMKQIEDNSVDCVITDPPFNISQDKKELSRKTMKSPMFAKRTSVRLDFGEWDKLPEVEYKNFIEMWFNELQRIMKPKAWCFIFFSKERVGYFTDPLNGLFNFHGFKTKSIISWHKTNPVPSFRKVNLLSSCEFIVAGSKGESRIPNFLMQKEMHNFFQTANSSSYGKTNHPTEKPLELLKWLIKIGSNRNDLILDCFLGSGTTAVACKQLGRNFIGIESEPEYIDIANKRLNQECL